MALIKCPECNHDVSTLATACPNCGYPMSAMNIVGVNNTICEILEKQYDLSKVLSLIKDGEKIKAIKAARETTGLGLAESSYLIDEIIQNGYKIPAKSGVASNSRKQASATTQPKCPTCGSTNVERINLSTRAAATMLFGVVSKTARSQFHCRSCGYKW